MCVLELKQSDDIFIHWSYQILGHYYWDVYYMHDKRCTGGDHTHRDTRHLRCLKRFSGVYTWPHSLAAHLGQGYYGDLGGFC